MKLTSNNQGGFTLVELMFSMVIALVSIISLF
jgi:prepilin-type N-terminal cleavage/methylation domain-containing protein